MESGALMRYVWGDVPTWLTAIGTCGAVIVALFLARRDKHNDRRRQAERITAWLGPVQPSGTSLLQQVTIQNASHQSVYELIASLVSVQGAFRATAVGDPRGFRTTVGQIPPGQHVTSIRSGGHGMTLKLGIELAFRDASGTSWIRAGDGRLRESKDDPVDAYQLKRPVEWENG